MSMDVNTSSARPQTHNSVLAPRKSKEKPEDPKSETLLPAKMSASSPKKRAHDNVLLDRPSSLDLPPLIDPKKKCRPVDAHSEIPGSQRGTDFDTESNILQLIQELRSDRMLLDIIAESGSIVEIEKVVEYLFQTCRVETFTLELLLRFWRYFPEAAKDLLRLFLRYGYWQQLLQLMDLGKKKKFGKQLITSSLELFQEQWNKDVIAFQSYQDLLPATGEPATMDSVEGPKISNLAVWLPRKGKHWDKKLGFIRRFIRLVYPKDKRSVFNASYHKQVNLFREYLRSTPSDHASENIALSSQESLVTMVDVPILRKYVERNMEDVDSYKTVLFLPDPESLEDNGGDVAQSQAQHQVTLPPTGRVDEHLMRNCSLQNACNIFLTKATRHLTQYSKERVLYINQGEVGHAVATQADIIVTDKVTTCHALVFRSESRNNFPLTSLAHVDCDRYDNCIRSIIEAHIAHHYETMSEEEKKIEKPVDTNKLDLQVHVVGGFEDERYSSTNISSWLMDTLAWNADEYKDIVKMTLKTCAISCMNDNGNACPIGRGLGVDLRTGDAFLAKVDKEIAGPAHQLRSARIWSGGDGTLNLVHNSKSHDFVFKSFRYGAVSNLNALLRLPDHKMIRRTSTSPDVEESDFCISVRNTLRFLREVDCTRVFGSNVDKPLIFRRVGASNAWRRTR